MRARIALFGCGTASCALALLWSVSFVSFAHASEQASIPRRVRTVRSGHREPGVASRRSALPRSRAVERVRTPLASSFRRFVGPKDYGVADLAHVVPIQERFDPFVFKELRQRRAPGFHIGTAGLINLDLISERGMGAILFDVNSNQEQFWGPFLAVLDGEPERRHFPEAIGVALHQFPPMRPNPEALARQRSGDAAGRWLVDHLREELNRGEGWMGSDDRYAHRRELSTSDSIIPVTVDIADLARWKQIGTWLHAQALTVSSFFTSNLTAFARRGYYAGSYSRLDFAKSIEAVSNDDPSTTVINAGCGAAVNMTAAEFRAAAEYMQQLGR